MVRLLSIGRPLAASSLRAPPSRQLLSLKVLAAGPALEGTEVQAQIDWQPLGEHAVEPAGCHNRRQVGDDQHPRVLAVEYEVVVADHQGRGSEQICKRSQPQCGEAVVGARGMLGRPRPADRDQRRCGCVRQDRRLFPAHVQDAAGASRPPDRKTRGAAPHVSLEAAVATPRPAGMKQTHEVRIVQAVRPDSGPREALHKLHAPDVERLARASLVQSRTGPEPAGEAWPG